MVIRYASAVLTLSALLALIMGIFFWFGSGLNFISMHMLLGFLAVASLWVIGIGQLFSPRRSWAIAVGAVAIGALTALLGLYQMSLIVGEFHWVIQATHLLLGISAIGLGHIGAARHRKGTTR